MQTKEQLSGYGYQQSEPAATDYSKIDGAEKPFSRGKMQRSGTLLERSASLLGAISKGELFMSKLFYFFFYAAFGSLFPLISIYFKQLGMNATQAGLLVGIRPFVEFASAPFWGGLADRFRKGKAILLFSLICWIVFTLSLDFIQPNSPFCLIGNSSHQFLVPALDSDGNKKSSPMGKKLMDLNEFQSETAVESEFAFFYLPEMYKEARTPGISPDILDKGAIVNYDPEKLGHLVSPPHSKKVYRKSAVEEVFLLLLITIIIGEFFSAPAITLADACTLNLLGDHPELYGRQRMFGSLGWGLAMFIIGIALDYSLVFPSHPCGLNIQEKNYTLCFAAFSVLMSCAFLVATQLKFSDFGEDSKKVAQRIMDSQIGNVDPLVAEQARTEAPEAQEVSPGHKWLNVMKTFATPHYSAFLFVTWWMGFGVGLVFCFLFWHLQDIGGSPSLYGLASVINHVSEIGAYFFSFRLINRIGHTKVLYVGLIANVARFLYISWLRDPWWVLPFEFIQEKNTSQSAYGQATVFIIIIILIIIAVAVMLVRDFEEQLEQFFNEMLMSCRKRLKTKITNANNGQKYSISVLWKSQKSEKHPLVMPLASQIQFHRMHKNRTWAACVVCLDEEMRIVICEGLTHAAVWAAATSYISLATPPQFKSSAQGLLQGLHHGLGRGCGALFGGLIITYTGTQLMFRAYGFSCLVILGIFYAVNRFMSGDGIKYHSEAYLDEQHTLAPHGIPMHVPFSPKSEKLLDSGAAGFYGTVDPTQEAYDRYVKEPYDKPVNFEQLPSHLGAK
ncbi:Major facilitator superfamily domain-containing protein 6 [Trichinella nelsoni]|uniref:Major facilitator superfamily domain-containing protein 6 n=1 Tax=Trichinella nelsoni TaxID=6336 RepID=A0A0V0SKZ3_9BILA|nr:Major facilitator superfamily domain-containing protein 6 [Trichinella nelsoni]